MGKWILTADLQFDEQRRYSKTLPNGLSSRLMDAVACWEWLVACAVEEGCEGIMVLGDLFDSRTVLDISVIDVVSRAFSAAASEGLELKIVVGNHDCYMRNASINSAQIFLGTADVYDEPVVSGDFAFLPWVDDHDVFAAQVEELAKSKAKYLFTHCLVAGAVPKASGIAQAVLRPDKWQVFLGDVHDPVSLANGQIQYVGSPMQWHYGDAWQTRGVFLLDTTLDTLEYIENEISPRFYTVASLKEVPEGLRAIDFVRVICPDVEESKKVMKKIAKSPAVNVEATAVEPLSSDDDPRIAVSPSDTQKAVLAKYVEYHRPEDSEVLVALGMQFMEEGSIL